MVLLDTDVLVECLRGSQTARQWLESNSTEPFAIPGVAAMELLVGCRNRLEQQRAQKFLDTFPIEWPDASEFERAYELLAAYRLSIGVGIPDCLIAAVALTRRWPLYTFSLK